MTKGLIVLHSSADFTSEEAKKIKDQVRAAVGNYDVLVVNPGFDVTIALPGAPPVTSLPD